MTERLASLSPSRSLQMTLYYLQWLLLFAWIPLTLFFVFVAPMGSVHDKVHAFRHAFANLPCH